MDKPAELKTGAELQTGRRTVEGPEEPQTGLYVSVKDVGKPAELRSGAELLTGLYKSWVTADGRAGVYESRGIAEEPARLKAAAYEFDAEDADDHHEPEY